MHIPVSSVEPLVVTSVSSSVPSGAKWRTCPRFALDPSPTSTSPSENGAANAANGEPATSTSVAIANNGKPALWRLLAADHVLQARISSSRSKVGLGQYLICRRHAVTLYLVSVEKPLV